MPKNQVGEVSFVLSLPLYVFPSFDVMMLRFASTAPAFATLRGLDLGSRRGVVLVCVELNGSSAVVR